LPVNGLQSKSWDEFAKPGAAVMNFVLTVCDSTAREVCPLWPGPPVTAHWGVRDPGNTPGSSADVERAFRNTFLTLDRRIGLFLSVPLASLSELAVKKELDEIGRK